MKKYLIILSFSCLFTACDKNENEDLIGQYFFDTDTELPDKSGNTDDGVMLTKGLVAFYPFEMSVSDASGNGLHAHIGGHIYDVEGHKAGTRAAYFDGDMNNYVYVPNSSKLQLDEWTINLWFYYDDPYDTKTALIQMGRTSVPGSFFICINKVLLVTDIGTIVSGTLYDDEERAPLPNTWHMLTTQVKDNTIIQYLDGQFEWKGAMPRGKYVNKVGYELFIGISKWNGAFDDAFYGYIDDIRIYNRLLSENEVNLLYSE